MRFYVCSSTLKFYPKVVPKHLKSELHIWYEKIVNFRKSIFNIDSSIVNS